MVTVKRDEDEDVGLTLVQHKKELFVADVDRGPFFKTAMDKGDKVLSICGKKIPKHIQTVAEAEALMEGKSTLTMFVLRPDPEKDVGYKVRNDRPVPLLLDSLSHNYCTISICLSLTLVCALSGLWKMCSETVRFRSTFDVSNQLAVV